MNEKQLKDAEIRAAFEARAGGAPPPDLAERIGTTARRTRQQRSLVWLPDVAAGNGRGLLLAAAVSATSLALVSGLLLAGRQNEDQTSVLPSPEASQTLTAPPSPSPRPSAEPTGPSEPVHGTVLERNTFVEVVATERLRIRFGPGLSNDGFDPSTYSFASGMSLLVVDGPLPADGYDWYHLLPAPDADIPGGWAAAADLDGTPWLVPTTIDCPASPMRSEDLMRVRYYGFVGCYPADRELVVTGKLSCTSEAPDRGVTGAPWLTDDRTCKFLTMPERLDVYGDFPLTIALPGVPAGTSIVGIYELTGHFNDAASESCVPTDDQADATLAVLSCRASFVVRSARPVLEPDSVAITVEDSVRVRSAPGVGAASAMREPLLPVSAKVFIVAGPVAADGYDWYQVQPFDRSLPFGWIAAASREGQPWLEAASQSCPSPVALSGPDLASLTSLGALACYGMEGVTVTGKVRCYAADVDHVISGPDWLHSDRYCELDLGNGTTMQFQDGGISGLGFSSESHEATIDGHFDDPQARSCTYGLEEPGADPASVILDCRTELVVWQLRAP
jgi:hypothetical protein